MGLSKNFKKWLRKHKKKKSVQKGGKKKKRSHMDAIAKNVAIATRSGIIPATRMGTYLAQTRR